MNIFYDAALHNLLLYIKEHFDRPAYLVYFNRLGIIKPQIGC